MNYAESYENQLNIMMEDAREWQAKHKDLTIKVQYNYGPEICVVGALQDAIDKKFVSLNDAALQMFKELGWLDDNPKQPTILMAKVVLENLFHIKHERPRN